MSRLKCIIPAELSICGRSIQPVCTPPGQHFIQNYVVGSEFMYRALDYQLDTKQLISCSSALVSLPQLISPLPHFVPSLHALSARHLSTTIRGLSTSTVGRLCVIARRFDSIVQVAANADRYHIWCAWQPTCKLHAPLISLCV